MSKDSLKKLVAIGLGGLGALASGSAASAASSPTIDPSLSVATAPIATNAKKTNSNINTRIGEKKAQNEMLADRISDAFDECLQTIRKVPGKPRAVSLDIPGRQTPLEVEIPNKYASEDEVMQVLCEKIVEANINSWFETIANKSVKDVNDLELSIYKYLDPKVQATVVHNSIEDVMTHRRKLSVEEFNTLSKNQPADEVNNEAKNIINKKGLINKAMQSHIRYFLMDRVGGNMYSAPSNEQNYGNTMQSSESDGEYYWQ